MTELNTESPADVRGGANYDPGVAGAGKAVKDKGKKQIEKKNVALEMLKVEYVPRMTVVPNDYNPNRQSEHDFELLCRSMREDGFTQPIVCLREGRVIVDGEHRWRAAGEVFGQESDIPVVFVDMTMEQARIATLRHNRARGSEDVELSAQLLRDLQKLGALDWAQDSLMLDDVEIERLLEDIPAPEALANEEFAEAWVPGEKSESPYAGSEAQVRVDAQSGGVRVDAATPEASNRIRAAETQIAQAKTQEERQMIQRDLNIFRVTLMFTGDEGKIVKTVLGDQPAAKVLEFCRAAYVPPQE